MSQRASNHAIPPIPYEPSVIELVISAFVYNCALSNVLKSLYVDNQDVNLAKYPSSIAIPFSSNSHAAPLIVHS